MVLAYNPCYSGDENQEDGSSKTTWAKSSQDTISTNKPGVMVHL
jgi:hypothetical protein